MPFAWVFDRCETTACLEYEHHALGVVSILADALGIKRHKDNVALGSYLMVSWSTSWMQGVQVHETRVYALHRYGQSHQIK